MKAAIYCRVSTEDQEREGTSLQSQLDACLQFAQDKGYTVDEQHIIKEVFSGLTVDRPDIPKLKSWINSVEIQAVIIYDSDRFSRDGYDFVTLIRDCEKANVALHCLKEPIEQGPIGELLSYVRGWASRREADKIKERTRRGIRERVKSGKLPGGRKTKLYGYDYLAGKADGQGVRVINENEARWVRQIFDWYVKDGFTLGRIVQELNCLRITPPSGKGSWTKATVHGILKNMAYMGKTYAFMQTLTEAKSHRKAVRKNKATHKIVKPLEDWIEIPNATPAIVSEQVFNMAQIRIRRNKELASRNTKREYLLSGYVFCKRCGTRRFTGGTRMWRNKNGVMSRGLYKCTQLTECRNHIWEAGKLEGIVWGEIERVLTNPELVIAYFNEAFKNQTNLLNEVQQIEFQLKSLDEEQEQLLHWALKGFPEDAVIRENEKINSNRAKLQERVKELKNRLESVKTYGSKIEEIKQVCKLVENNLTELSFANRRSFLEALSIKVWIDGENVEIEGAIPVEMSAIASTIW